MDLVDFSWIFRGFGGFFVELVDFSWIFRGIGGFFMELVDFSWIFDEIGGFVGRGEGGNGQGCSKDAPRMLQGCSRDANPLGLALPTK